MLDIKAILENLDEAARRLKARDPSIDLPPLVKLDSDRRRLIGEVEELQAHRNRAGKEIGAMKKAGQEPSDLLAEMKALSERISAGETELEACKRDLEKLLEGLPNIPIDPTPLEGDKSANEVVRESGDFRTPEEWSFPFRNHIEVGEGLGERGGLDFPRAARMTGSNWPLYRGELARLEWALVWFFIDRAVADGRELILPPYLVNSESMYASGQFPKFRDQAYECRDDDLVLIPTSEVSLLNLYRGEILPGDMLPLRLVSFTPCFRREAGTYGKGERGLIRTHQFHKVEIFSFTRPDDSNDELPLMTRFAESLMDDLELPYRTTVLAAGELAQQSACTYDVEIWLPGQEAFSEVSSVSNCTDYQARRASIRFRPAEGKKPEFAHTLNGSALATSRVMVGILEQYQEQDGGLRIPSVLQAYLGGMERIEPLASTR